MSEKAQLRKALVAARAKVHGVVNARAALVHAEDVLRDKAGPVSVYWPIRTELDPRPLMERLVQTREVCLPVTHGRAALSFRPWRPGAAMEVDGFGVSVPVETRAVVPSCLIVPLLGFDRRGHRLGYGAGHYDRTLMGLRQRGTVFAVGLAYGVQEIDEVPIEVTDQALDAVVTENGVIWGEGGAVNPARNQGA